MSAAASKSFAADTSVVVAGLSAWHPHHVASRALLARRPAAIAHVLVETYSVLTRLPAPQRVSPAIAAEAIRRSVHDAPVAMHADSITAFLERIAEAGVAGGGAYDALVAETARQHGLTLYSLDRRARSTYESVGADVVWIDGIG